ncbi:MAG: tyrosine-type recombinase/integrase [Planctomycetota bacterium]|jgi:integrase
MIARTRLTGTAFVVTDGYLTLTDADGNTAVAEIGEQPARLGSSLDADALQSLITSAVSQAVAAKSGPAKDHSLTPLTWWQNEMRRLQTEKQRKEYRPRLQHVENRVRWCEDCQEAVVCRVPYEKSTAGVEPITPRQCPDCYGLRISYPASCYHFDSAVLLALHRTLVKDGLSISSATGVITYVRAVINSAREAGHDVPVIKRLTLPKSPKSITLWSLEELRRFLAVVDEAVQPTFVDRPGDWWRVWLSLGLLAGMRLSEITALTWDDIHEAAIPPDDELAAAGVKNEAGWLVYLPEKQGAAKPDPLVLPRSRVLADVMQLAAEFPGFKLAPFSRRPAVKYRNNQGWYKREIKRLRALAGIERSLTAHDLRRTFETYASRQFGRDWALAYDGHADRSVSGTSYCEQVVAFVDKVDEFELNQLLVDSLQARGSALTASNR